MSETKFKISVRMVFWVTALVAVWLTEQFLLPGWVRIAVESFVLFCSPGPLLGLLVCGQGYWRVFAISATPSLVAFLWWASYQMSYALAWLQFNFQKDSFDVFGDHPEEFGLLLLSRASLIWVPLALFCGFLGVALVRLSKAAD